MSTLIIKKVILWEAMIDYFYKKHQEGAISGDGSYGLLRDCSDYINNKKEKKNLLITLDTAFDISEREFNIIEMNVKKEWKKFKYLEDGEK